MRQIEFNGEILEYNEKCWELRDIPRDFLNKNEFITFDKALHYIGPIVNGSIIEEYPWRMYEEIPMYRTFEGCKGLTKSPAIYRNSSYQMFKDCDDFTDIEGAFNRYKRQGGRSYSNLFDGSNIKQLYDAATIRNSISDTEDDELTFMDIKYATKQVLRMLLDAFSCTEEDWQSIAPVDDKIYFSTGAFLCLKTIHRASEITEWHKVIHKNCIVTCTCSPVRILYENVTVYFLADDFINDTDDVNLMQITGFEVNQPFYDSTFPLNENAILNVNTDSTIETDGPCLACRESLTIKGSGQHLTLRCKDNRQPCIGVVTHDGMSYGRWEPSRDRFTKLTLDNVHVTCNSTIPNFSIGRYGTNDLPEIELLNGATLECPEMTGKRIMIKSGSEGLYGSTKRCEDAVYEITQDTSVIGVDDSQLKKENSGPIKKVQAF